MRVIPAINATTFDDARKKIKIAAAFAEWIHLDIADGTFTPNILWGSPQDIRKLREEFPTLSIEVHLMVSNPLQNLDAWFSAGVARVAAHCEVLSLAESAECAKIAHSHGKKFLIALLPQTNPEVLLPYLADTDGAFVLSVNPGFAGQKFQKKTTNTLAFLQQHAPQKTVEVDGGIDDETAVLVKNFGATDIVSASYIFNYPNPKIAFSTLEAL